MPRQERAIQQSLSRRVLVLDFDPITLIALEQLLEEAGFGTTTTWSMHEACYCLEQERFDLVVVGDHLPQIDAVVIVRHLENLHRRVPCIVMRAGPDFCNDPKWSGLVTALPGCAGSEILEKVHQCLGRSASTRSSRERTHLPVIDEPVLVKMMWGKSHA